MHDGLTPAQRRGYESGLAKCNRCRGKLEFLRDTGSPNEELEERVAHYQQMAERAIAWDDRQRMASRMGGK